ncbi:UTP--glucose-1-phosphate uridylyltransferase [Paenibacillus alkalitolerans]|uniref:UTP--glucose-1-phosphate uridylyltransferase n=1 Tax=Paenibacillus alkalitolerans TaxID=2799335 RepID=UPI0018F6AEFC|nr:UDPGP type 1 family protein [Paenibacillus alkalitolerans]
MDTGLEQVQQLLIKYKQEHVLDFLKRLDPIEKDKLIQQILSIDFVQLSSALNKVKHQKVVDIESIEPMEYQRLDQFTKEQRDMYAEEGWRLLRNGEVGVIVVAGGQGSRLGHEGPKGTLDIDLPSGKSLFQLQAERLLNLSNRAAQSIPWYIMTSPENHDATIQFFQSHNYFGYPKTDCIFFQQKTMPAIDQQGKLLFSSPSQINFVPSGNGECFSSLYHSGALEDMKRRGITWLFYYNVDNAIIKAADPLFVGFSASFDNTISTKAIKKVDPEEKVGVLCLKNGRPFVLEYNEIPDALLQQRNSQGELLLGLANISIHMFRYDFIEKYARHKVPYHVALKKIKYSDTNGTIITPDEPNAYKLESFIFDYFPFAEKTTVLLAEREEEFAPVKNKEGADSPLTARNQILNLHKKWLADSGVDLAKLGLQDRFIEISPLLSYGGEGINEGIDKIIKQQGMK